MVFALLITASIAGLVSVSRIVGNEEGSRFLSTPTRSNPVTFLLRFGTLRALLAFKAACCIVARSSRRSDTRRYMRLKKAAKKQEAAFFQGDRGLPRGRVLAPRLA